MKLLTIIGSSSLFLLMGLTVPVYAQDKPEEPKPQEEKKPAEKPKPPEEKPKEQPKKPHDTPDRPAEKPAERPAEKPAERPAEKPGEQPRSEHAPATRDEHARTEQGRNDQAHKEQAHGGGKRIPDDKFKTHFGQEHHFHVGHPRVEGGRSQFAYGGYNFYFVEPWPAAWGYDDDVYIVDIDGVYYLVDAVHPGAQLQVDVVL
jgi:hypothetical protein